MKRNNTSEPAHAPGPTQPKRRRRGRPADSGGADYRTAILAAAERSFAARGYTATSMRRIADQAGVTPAMIHYYFGNKNALFREVLDNALEPLAAAIVELRASGRDTLEHFPALLIGLGAEHPHLPVLVAREVFLPGGQLQAHFIEHFAPRLGGALPDLLAREQESGRVDPDFDPSIAALLVLGTCFFPLLARPLAEQALGVQFDEAGLARLESQIRLLLNQGMKS